MVEDLIDFFEGRGRFKSRDEYVGMDASQIPEIFVAYFTALSPPQKKEMAEIIAGGAVGHAEALIPYLQQSMRLLLDLCMRGHPQDFVPARETLEQEFNDPSNRKLWIAAEDVQPPSEGAAYKSDWHYPLMLWGVLYLLKSSRIATVHSDLMDNAASESFKEALTAAEGVYDQLNQG